MSNPTAQLSSPTTGHGCWPSTTICEAAETVIAEGLPVACLGHAAIPHVCIVLPFPVHGLVVAEGSQTVIVEGVPAARIGDSMSCGDLIASGSPTVITGD
jgi:uncharacterized Zn-binding protein involved in type VI secretion